MTRAMRVTRGLYASLGASGSLLAGGACLLLLASAVIAYRGWPNVSDVVVSSRSVTLSGAHERSHPTQRVVVASPASGGPASAPAARRTGERQTARGGVPPVRPRAATPVRQASPAPAPAPSSVSPAPSTPTPASAPSTSPTDRTTDPVAQAVTQTGREVGGDLGAVNPDAGAAVEQTTATAGDVVEQVGDTAGGLLKKP
jgi:hypothetical protein